ncbi:hypothetical protein LRS73_26950 [Methylobacterium currus]|uniref:hyaluronate lyase N-terminal domain-containing protein n=1 Tax=Methylobacterium currus TaxID=2051553 RepID=UPI001E4BD8DA|nr:hypothetical protein [Methylobacterium currus]UHC16075.1 hypothetical protein LRS73_26950 [Methylobacterium currus]
MSIRLQFLRETWAFLRTFTGRPGEIAVDTTNNRLVVHDGTTPGGFPTATAADLKTLQNVTLLGLGTTADAQNPFAAKLNTALWTALTNGEGGSGDLRYTLNKEASGNTLSLLLQSGYSGRAELGLTGDDDLRVKVSPDGSTWREALRIDRATGGLDLTAAEATMAVAATVDLGALPALKVALTGAGTVTSFGTSPNRVRLLRFTGAATLTHNPASLVLPGGATLVTAAGDTALATSDAAGTWTVRDYVRVSGKPVTGPAAADITDASATGRSVLTGTAAQGATALGLGTGNSPTLAGVILSSSSSADTVQIARLLSPAAASGTSYTTLRIEKGPNYGGEIAGYLTQGIGGGMRLSVLNGAGNTVEALRLDGTGAATFGGVLNGGYATFSGVAIAGSAGTQRRLVWSSGTSLRWALLATDNAETGSNAGSDLFLARYADSSAYLDSPFVVSRATGKTSLLSLAVYGPVAVSGPLSVGVYTVATLPTGTSGTVLYVSNGRKVGEGAGAGTGVVAYYSNGNWRRLSDDSAIAA